MKKYIDAEKLKAEIRIIQQSLEHRDVRFNQIKKIRTECMIEFCKRIFDVIDSFQQENEIVEFTFKGGTYRVNGEEHAFKGGKAKVIILEINQEEESE